MFFSSRQHLPQLPFPVPSSSRSRKPIFFRRNWTPALFSLASLVIAVTTFISHCVVLAEGDSPGTGGQKDVSAPGTSSGFGGAGEKGEKGEKVGKKQLRAKAANVEELLQAIRALPAEKRQQLRENLRTWQNLSDGQRQQLRERETSLRKKAAEELAACLPDAKLSAEDQELFQKRYIEERRKIEAALRAETEGRRKSELERLNEKFRDELRQRTGKSEGN